MVTHAMSLGSIARDYEDRTHRAWRDNPQPTHRDDDQSLNMRPDENNTLLVLARCMKHYTRQLREDVIRGVEAPCPQRCPHLT